MTQERDAITKLFLSAVYPSLGRAVEISFMNGDNAVGVFSGMDHDSGKVLVLNFCYANAEKFEDRKVLAFKDIRCFTVHDTTHRRDSPPKRPAPAAAHPHHDYPDPKPSRANLANSNATHENGDGPKAPLRDKPRGIKNDVFRTDVEISKKTHDSKAGDKKGAGFGQKVFQKFKIEDTFGEDTLEGGKLGDFDQFSANRQFGIDSQFNENDYTTHLDLNKVPKAQIERAERLAREIESSVVGDVAQSRHWQEERNLVKLKDNDDEEALYSAVVREEPEAEPAKHPEPKRVPFRLREVKEGRKEGFRAQIDKCYVLVRKEAAAKDNLVHQLSPPQPPAQTQPAAKPPQAPMNGYYQPMMTPEQQMLYGQQMMMGGYGYPMGAQPMVYYPQSYYQGYQVPPGMYVPPSQYQPPR